MAPLGRTRTPKPGSWGSQTENSAACDLTTSTTRLVMRRSAMTAPSCLKNLLGKHRGNTEKEVPGTSRKQGTLGDAHDKRFFERLGKIGKLKEPGVFRMAFKRSGVRLPLAPPNPGSARTSD